MSIQLSTLPNGLRVITDRVPSVGSVAVGVWADAGARHEDLRHNGIAHMVEHMMFKGTPNRSAAQIAEQIEDVGGRMNAYTSRELTAYHIHLLKDDLSFALDILGDIMKNPVMPDQEVERERSVILQEIGMTNDTPDDLIFDQYQETAYPGQALGAPILGTSEIIGGMERDELIAYVQQFYTPARLVISAAGHVDHEAFVAEVAEKFLDLPADRDFEVPAADYQGGEIRTQKELEQAHIILGFQGISRLDPDYHSAMLLATLMGGGMSSRLFQEIREKRGLVYSVFSFHHSFQDDGQFAIYAGTGPGDLTELVPVLCDEIGKMTREIKEEELLRAKAQIRANLLMGREAMLRRANQQAKHLIHYGEKIDIEERLKDIEAVTLTDLAKTAGRIFSTKPTLAALGPLHALESYDAVQDRLAA